MSIRVGVPVATEVPSSAPATVASGPVVEPEAPSSAAPAVPVDVETLRQEGAGGTGVKKLARKYKKTPREIRALLNGQ